VISLESRPGLVHNLAHKRQYEHLSEKRYVTVVVRMLIDRREQLVRGEIVDVNGIGQGQFAGWQGLIRTMRDYLTKQQG